MFELHSNPLFQGLLKLVEKFEERIVKLEQEVKRLVEAHTDDGK